MTGHEAPMLLMRAKPTDRAIARIDFSRFADSDSVTAELSDEIRQLKTFMAAVTAAIAQIEGLQPASGSAWPSAEAWVRRARHGKIGKVRHGTRQRQRPPDSNLDAVSSFLITAHGPQPTVHQPTRPRPTASRAVDRPVTGSVSIPDKLGLVVHWAMPRGGWPGNARWVGTGWLDS